MAVSRRQAREIALKTLYRVGIGGMDANDALESEFEEQAPAADDRESALGAEATRDYARRLVEGVVAHGEEYDALVARYSKGWDVDRMPTVDRILLHMGLFELTESRDVPPGVVINEAVEMAKEYSTDESGKFVNGILGAYSRAEGPESGKRKT